MSFRNVNIIFSVLTLLFIPLILFMGWSLWLILLPLPFYIFFLAFGAARIHSSFFIKAHCRGGLAEKKIAITFDDGPHAEFSARILDLLKENNIPATFFMIGKNITGNEFILKRAAAEGHILANHSYSHSFFIDLKSKTAWMDELKQTSALISSITGKQVRWFRPPYGVTTPHLAAAAKELDYDIIGWDVRSLDTTADDAGKILERVTSQVKPGSIILFHDTSAKSLEVLKQTLNFTAKNGFKIVSAEEILQMPAYRKAN
jgi:peptidoglycan/xylan/chitin deacetylase (PgdA/CDA1 family)